MPPSISPARALWAALLIAAAGATPALAQDSSPSTPAVLSVAEHVKASNGQTLAGVKRVAIPTFIVHFVRDQGIERSGGSFGMFQGQSATYFTQVRGIEAEQLHAVADALYEQLVAELKGAGIEVVPIAEMDANSDFQEIRKTAKRSPVVEALEFGTRRDKHMSVNMLATAKGLPLFVRNVIDERWLPGQAFPAEGMQGMTLVLGAGKMAQVLQAPLLNVRMSVALAEQKGRGWGGVSSRPDFVLNRWVKTKSARWEFQTDPFVRYVEQGTRITLTNPGMDLQPAPTSFVLTQPAAISGVEIDGVAGEGGNARGSGLLGALGRAVSGSNQTNADLYLEVNAANLSDRLIADGKPVLRVLVQALTGQGKPH